MTLQPAVRRMILATAIFLAIALTLFLTGPSGIGGSLAEANGQGVNTPATNLPTIRGTVLVGKTLTADTSGIADENGLENAAFTYQWMVSDGNTDTGIEDATESTYTPSEGDDGKTIKVWLHLPPG